MICKDISFETPEENIVYDNLLLSLAEKAEGPEVLRFWESGRYFIVLGRTGCLSDEVKVTEVTKAAIPVVRRASGGGTVLQGKGCLNYSLILAKKSFASVADLRGSYLFILEKVIRALKKMGVEAAYFPISDIALVSNKKKISGNAQKRLRNHILHHGTLMYDFDLSLIEKYLSVPKQMPDYRCHRSHLDFVANLPTQDKAVFKNALRQEFHITVSEFEPSKEEKRLLAQMQQAHKIRVF